MTEEMNADNELSLRDILDIASFQNLTDSLTQITGIAMAIVDIDGDILVASGWQKICVDFHRQHPLTAKRCLESDTAIANRLEAGQKYNVYRCRNGLVDVAVPIVIDGCHFGNLFVGQFLSERPDLEFFTKQAQEFGFPVQEYLDLLRNVPIVTEAKVRRLVDFLEKLTVVIGNNGFDKKKLLDLNANLENRVQTRTIQLQNEIAVRKRAEAEMETAKNYAESLVNSLPGIMYLFDEDGHYLKWNDNLERLSGYSADELARISSLQTIRPADRERVRHAMQQVFEEGSSEIEAGFLTKEGRIVPFLFTGFRMVQAGKRYIVGIGVDISSLAAAKKEKEQLIAQLQDSLGKVKQLSGFLPICAACKKIRDDEGYWKQLEAYIREHSDVVFSHGICPECAKKLYPGVNLPDR